MACQTGESLEMEITGENGEESSPSCTHSTHRVDDDFYYLAALLDEDGDDELFLISDETYAEKLELQEVLLISLAAVSHVGRPSSPPARKAVAKKARGESSGCRDSLCRICMDVWPSSEMVEGRHCSHAFCSGCMSTYVAGKVRENVLSVTCPGVNCQRVLEPEQWQEMVPREVWERWSSAVCESMILASERFYCPFKDCSLLMVDDGEEPVTQAECPSCRRLFCAKCNVKWHAGVDCEEFGRLKVDERETEDLMLMETAKKNNWMRCPRCKFYVEKTEGCEHIVCRCKYEFCYHCGSKWGTVHHCK